MSADGRPATDRDGGARGWLGGRARPSDGPGTPLPETRVWQPACCWREAKHPSSPFTAWSVTGLICWWARRTPVRKQRPGPARVVPGDVVAGGRQVVATSRISLIPFPAQGLPLTALVDEGGRADRPSRCVWSRSPRRAPCTRRPGAWPSFPGPRKPVVSGPGTVFGSGHLTGRRPAVTVVVDGQQVEVAPDGSSPRTSARPLPTEVRVGGHRHLGQQDGPVVSVVAPLHYRQPPWIPIVFVVVVVGGSSGGCARRGVVHLRRLAWSTGTFERSRPDRAGPYTGRPWSPSAGSGPSTTPGSVWIRHRPDGVRLPATDRRAVAWPTDASSARRTTSSARPSAGNSSPGAVQRGAPGARRGRGSIGLRPGPWPTGAPMRPWSATPAKPCTPTARPIGPEPSTSR